MSDWWKSRPVPMTPEERAAADAAQKAALKSLYDQCSRHPGIRFFGFPGYCKDCGYEDHDGECPSR